VRARLTFRGYSDALAVQTKGLGLFVVLVDVVAHRHNSVPRRRGDAPAEPLPQEVAEEALDHVEATKLLVGVKYM